MNSPYLHPEAAALYRAILAEPAEDTPRLAFADWLDEHDNHTRAEFIRLQCRLARMNKWDEGYTADKLRAARLFKDHWHEWWVPPGGPPRDGRYHYTGYRPIRGFPGGVNFTTYITPEEAREWFARHPITEADLYISDQFGSEPRLERLATDALPGLRTLILDTEHSCTPETRAAACRALANEPARAGLTRLEIKGDPTLAGLEAIITSPHLRRLEALSVRGDGVGDDHARLLAAKVELPALRELALGHRALTPAGAESLGRAEWFDRLQTLRLYGHELLGDAGLMKLLGFRPFPNLRTLELHNCGQTGDETAVLARLPALEELIEYGPTLAGDHLSALTNGPARFRSLRIAADNMSRATAAEFFNGPALSELRRLHLTHPNTSTPMLEAIVASPLPAALRVLHFPGQSWADPVAALVAGPPWPCLERLHLPNGAPSASLLALIASEKFPRLVSLETWCTDSVPTFLKKLAQSPGTARFRELDLKVHLTPGAAKALAASPHLDGLDRLHLYKGRTDPKSCERLVKRFGKRIEIEGYAG